MGSGIGMSWELAVQEDVQWAALERTLNRTLARAINWTRGCLQRVPAR